MWVHWKAKPWLTGSTVSVLQGQNIGAPRKIDPLWSVLGELKAEIHEDDFFVHVCLNKNAVASLAHLKSRPEEPVRVEGAKAAKKKEGTEDGMHAKPKMIRNQSDYNPPGCGRAPPNEIRNGGLSLDPRAPTSPHKFLNSIT